MYVDNILCSKVLNGLLFFRERYYMSSFRKYGGVNRSAVGNIVRHHYANETNMTISNSVGLDNSKILSQSHLDMSCNSILNVNSIYF